MTSNDNFVTVEIFNAGIQDIKSEIREVKYQEQLTTARIEWLQHSIYWGFAIIGIVIALIGLRPFKKDNIEKKSDLTERDLRALMREEISMTQVANVGK